MTPVQLLDNVKARFHTLMHDEPAALEALLRQALTAYQDLAGVTNRHRYEQPADSGMFDLPPGFLARIGVSDANGNFISSTVWFEGLELKLTGAEVYPLTLTYAVSLTDIDLDTFELPPNAIGMISDYLEALITIPNTERIRRVAMAGKIDVSDLPTQSELVERKTAIEATIRSARSIISPFSILG